MHLHHKTAYHYDLPKELIAQYPLKSRDSSKLMVINKKNKTIKHELFKDIINYINKGDVLVLNNTKVIPARLSAKKDTGGIVEIFLLTEEQDNEWICMVKPGKRLKTGLVLTINESLTCEIISVYDDGKRLIRFHDKDKSNIKTAILSAASTPLPPYITRNAEEADEENYQTVYAKHDGSVAAPTAGFHFTTNLLDKIKQKGVIITEVTLHVGLGTFKPVETDNITDHIMHLELCEINKETADIINNAKKAGNKIFSVGTTTTRTLESFTNGSFLEHGRKSTDIFFYPGKDFKIVDAQITNFHLPESTLIMLVAAFAGYELIMQAYKTAIELKYRFFSYGDAMLIVEN